MSTFNGEIEEISGICVDNFENKDFKCYFLSHCHSDHMKCLENLSQISAPLYTTNLSAVIIKQKYPSINIHVLEYGFAENIEFLGHDGSEIKFMVTALNGTGHCMGACMFLFQIEGLDILYTGDFRISLKHARNIKVLNEIRSYKNLIMYLDTTFLNESYKHFPSQSDSCSKVVEIIEKYLNSSSNHKVCLQTPARYGYERLIIEINKKLNEQIFIHESAVFELYSVVSDLTTCITSDSQKARVSLKPSFISSNSEANKNLKSNDTLTIQLSAMFWRNWNEKCTFETYCDKSHRVCYATHNSLSELQDFITFLEPKSIKPTVIPNNEKDKNGMFSLINNIMDSYKGRMVEDINSEPRKKFRFKRLHNFTNDKSCNQIIKKIKH